EIGDLFVRKLCKRAISAARVPLSSRLAQTKVTDLIDVDGCRAVPEKIVQEAAHPCVAGLRIGGKPDQGTHCAFHPSHSFLSPSTTNYPHQKPDDEQSLAGKKERARKPALHTFRSGNLP